MYLYIISICKAVHKWFERVTDNKKIGTSLTRSDLVGIVGFEPTK